MDYAHSHRTDRHYAPAPLPPARRLVPAPPPPPALSRDEAWALVAPHRARLIAVARGRGLSLPDAQDVAHHVMCRAVERGCLDPERVGAYLVKAAVNRCTDLAEDTARQARLLARTRGDERLAGPVDDAVCDRAQVRWLLAKLPERERRVLLLSAAGETVTGIASATGLSYPTVDRLLSRARKEMRRLAGALGVAWPAVWRQRRLVAPSATTAAVAIAGVSALTLQPLAPRSVAPQTRQVIRELPAAPERPAARPRAATGAPAPARQAPAALAPPAAVPPSHDSTGVGGEPILSVPATAEVRRGEDGVAEQVRKCLRNGVDVQLSRRGGVVCKETVASYIAGTAGVGRT